MTLGPWAGIAMVVGVLISLLVALGMYKRSGNPHPEVPRKLAHMCLGLLALSFPWVFAESWPVFLLAGLSLALMVLLRKVPFLRSRVGGVFHDVSRESYGEMFFPISVAVLFYLADGDRILYCVPLFVLGVADAVAALVGIFYGRVHYSSGLERKSAEGSVAFFLVAFLGVLVPLLLFTQTGRAETLVISLITGLLVMLLEAVAREGRDNLYIPLGGYALLHTYRGLDAERLVVHLGVLVALMLFGYLWRKRTLLSHTGLIVIILLGYMTWALGGWKWVLPPLALFISYKFTWPKGSDLRRQSHGVRVAVTVMSAGLIWLLAYAKYGGEWIYFPYTISYASHLAFLCNWRRDAVVKDVLLAPAKSWVIQLIPLSQTEGFLANWAGYSLWTYLAIVVACVLSEIVIPRHQAYTEETFPWWRRGVIAGLVSLMGCWVPRMGF